MRAFLLAILALGSLAVLNANPVPEDESEVMEFDEEGYDDDDESARFGFGSLAKFSFTQLVKEGAKQVGKQGAKQIGKLAIKQGFKEGIKQGAKQAGKFLIKAGAQLTKQGIRVIKSGAVKIAKSQVVKQGKRYVIKMGKEALKEAATMGAEYAVGAIQNAIQGGPEGEEEPIEDQEIDVIDYIAHADLCQCTTNQLCSCCAEIGEYPKGCFTMKLEESLFKPESKVIVQGVYDGTRVLRNKFPVNGSKRKCVSLDLESGDKFSFCVSSFGSEKDGPKRNMCFDLEFNGQTIRKCIQQTKNLKLSMLQD